MKGSKLRAYMIGLLYTILAHNFAAALGLANITAELGPRLSPGARIILPNSPDFTDATRRWSPFAEPRFTVVVDVATEQDVAETVEYANEEEVPFLAVSGAHGTVTSLANFHYGIEVWLHRLNWTTLSEDGDTVTFGGGILGGHLVDALWRSKKYTVTGVCECIGYLGPLLGGGHGVLQGKYGLASDQIISLRLVTADGQSLDVSESEPDPELFWALQGAGHNFGIVTSVTARIYDVPDQGVWAREGYYYGRNSIENAFETWNQILPRQPPTVTILGVLERNISMIPTDPLLKISVLQENVSRVDSAYTEAFRALNPIAITSQVGTYRDIPGWELMAFNSTQCAARNISAPHFAVGLQRWNTTALRMVYEAFSAVTAGNSSFNASEVIFEGYPVQAKIAIPEDSTAYPFREDNLYAYPLIRYNANASLDHTAIEVGDALRRIILEGSGREELHVYVNFAAGDEAPEQIYGYEEWRLDKLKELKKKYDPERRFSYFAPIPI
ncbi:FAD-binding domain-containing protein [Aspergillus uvarum CBS 121591]|uniref:FAD-binding domain-containing protein n=1 Tax=Aspergillus uvarum CBS 121591 TaxID=1448315 RepID=A0A319CT92_9EURO|nr:FAD-binding domain-containing protein [Aspergillus uvarum CBS 121591]PYH85967.1 FAD-binding domain-containing protein [Aspergillus uvarum CBS 121591]